MWPKKRAPSLSHHFSVVLPDPGLARAAATMASPAASLRPRHTATTDAPPRDGGGWEGGEGDGTELRPPRPSTSAPSSLPARAWAAYTAALAAHPLRTRACTAGALAALADAVGQALAAAPPPPGRRRAYPLSGWRRSLAWGAWGVLVSGPAGHAWQAVLDRVLPMPGGAAKAQREEEGGTAPPTSSSTSTAATLAARVAADAGLFSPAVNALALAFIATVIEGGSKRNGGSSTAGLVRARLPATQAAAWRLWPAASAVAYLAIPPRLRVLFFNAVGFWWTLLLSSRAAKGGGGERGGRRA